MNFSNRVAIVTGAGQGLGRAYAQYLGSKGARVIVNDVNQKAGETVAQSIRESNGVAIANGDDILKGSNIVEQAMDKWGQVDILINNAGIIRDKSFPKLSEQDWTDVLDVHLTGTKTITQAAWPYMKQAKYGRIVNITSASGLYGNFGQANYSAAKSGLCGLTFTLAQEGAKDGIAVNAVAPLAASQMTEGILEEKLLEKLTPENVAPYVAYLCHEDCSRSGKVYEVGGGWFGEVRWQQAPGLRLEKSELTLEQIADRIDQAGDFEQKTPKYPRTLLESVNILRKLLQ